MKKLLRATLILFTFSSANLLAAPLQLTDLQTQRNTLSMQLQKLDDIGRQIDAARSAKSQAELDIQTQEDALRKAKAKLEKFQALNREDPGMIPEETVRAVERENATAYKALQAAKAALIKADAAINSGNVAATKQTAEVQRQHTAFERNVSQLTETEVQQRIKALTVSKTVKVTERVTCGEDSLPRCKERAKQAASQKATEQGSTIFLNSSTEVRNFKLSQEQIRSEVNAALSNVEFSKVVIIDEAAEATLTATVTPTISPNLREQLANTVREEIYAAVGGKLEMASVKNPAGSEIIEPAPAQAGRAFKDCADCPEMVVVPAGSFNMGSSDSEAGHDADESPQHRVNIRSMSMGKTEVTVGEFRRFIQATHYQTDAENNVGGVFGCYAWEASDGKFDWRAELYWDKPGFSQTEQQPVVCVSWRDASAYVNWIAKKASQPYRLPTEAEWEYAARGNTASARYWGDNPNEACRYGNVADTTTGPGGMAWGVRHECPDGYFFTAPVASYSPNAFGLYDMLGNAWEWTQDTYHRHYAGAPTDGSEWQGDGATRVLRGGSSSSKPQLVRSARRDGNGAFFRSNNDGFRLAKTLP